MSEGFILKNKPEIKYYDDEIKDGYPDPVKIVNGKPEIQEGFSGKLINCETGEIVDE